MAMLNNQVRAMVSRQFLLRSKTRTAEFKSMRPPGGSVDFSWQAAPTDSADVWSLILMGEIGWNLVNFFLVWKSGNTPQHHLTELHCD